MVHVITSLSLQSDSVGIVEGKDGSIYEITSAKTIHYIDQVQKLYRDDGIGKGMKEISNPIRIRWNNEIKFDISLYVVCLLRCYQILINYFIFNG